MNNNFILLLLCFIRHKITLVQQPCDSVEQHGTTTIIFGLLLCTTTRLSLLKFVQNPSIYSRIIFPAVFETHTQTNHPPTNPSLKSIRQIILHLRTQYYRTLLPEQQPPTTTNATSYYFHQRSSSSINSFYTHVASILPWPQFSTRSEFRRSDY